MSAAARVRSLDWHRTLVVFAMIECHALVFLSPALDGDPLRAALNSLNGLIAPSFLLLAGLSLGYGVFGARDEAARLKRLNGAVRRAGEVLLTALVFRCVSTPALTEPAWKWWLQIDILTCIALSLFALQPLLRLLGGRPRFGACVLHGLAASVFALAPFTETARDLGGLEYLLNRARGSMFPLVPWCGYALLGAALGATLGSCGGRAFLRALALVALAYGALAAGAETVLRVFAEAGAEGYWAINAAERVWKTAAVAFVLRAVEDLPGVGAKADASRFFARATLFGRRSLSGYVTHLLVIYGLFGIQPLVPFHGRCAWLETFALTALVTATTYGVCAALERRENARRPA
jgi:uncharacterized membrane protein